MTTSTPADLGPEPGAGVGHDELTLQVVEERLAIEKRVVVGDIVRVSTTTEVVEAIAEIELDRYHVEVTRVPVGRVVEEAPLARAEGDITIVPVIEERLVVVKQLFLKEELHIRHVIEREVKREPVTLRRQRATVERRTAVTEEGDEG